MISPIFTTVVISFLFIFLYTKKTTRDFNTGDDAFLERERKANATRRQSLDSLTYVEIPFDTLPIPEESSNPEVNEAVSDFLALKDKKITNFTGISNTDLKMTYGVANLPYLTECDQNFTALCCSLNTIGDYYYKTGDIDNALTILEYAVAIGSDIKLTFSDLADIYADKFEFNKIDSLLEAAGNLNSLMKEPIIRMLNEKCDISTFVSNKEE